MNPTINIEEIKEKIEEFNSNPAWLTLDKITGEIFEHKVNTFDIAKQVLIINRAWGGAVKKYEKQLLENITGYWNEIGLHIIKIPLTESNKERIIRKIDILWPLFFKNNESGHVFFSKFLHWHAPGTFPIADKYSRDALRNMEPEVNYRASLNNYRNVITAYTKLIENLKNEHSNSRPNILTELINYDYETQINYPLLQRKNSLLRVLDKWLWRKGHQEGGDRMAYIDPISKK